MIVGHAPSGSSVHTLLHFLQFFQVGRFQAFDYGADENLRRYNSILPPLYNLSRTDVPVQGFYGGNDWIVDQRVSKKTENEIKS